MNPRGPVATTWPDAQARMKPFTGRRAFDAVDPSTLDGKVMCGYQGWFLAQGDGAGLGWSHYGGREFRPGLCAIDFWPDMSEMTPGEQYATDFRNADGSVATVFSSYNPQTVDRHFAWMAQNGIDGVFLQRFGGELRTPQSYDKVDGVLENVRAAANANGRTWAVMYDLSGLDEGEINSIAMQDWKDLVDRMQVTQDPSYQHYRGKPLVAVWGIGFNDHRKYSLQACAALVDFLQHDPQYGGNAVMVGLPYYWRELKGDAVPDPALLDLARHADIVSPWAVGRYGPAEFASKLEHDVKPDIAWCQSKNIGYLPVIFPGYRWKNTPSMDNPNFKLIEIPRKKGAFFWQQGSGVISAGAKMIYIAMFDEMNEGTAIFKCTNTPPVGASSFGTLEGLPTDTYLWLAGRFSAMLKGQMPWQPEMPKRTDPAR